MRSNSQSFHHYNNMTPLAKTRLIIALCGAALPWSQLLAPSAAAWQNPARKRLPAINLIYPNGLALDDKGDLSISDIGAHRVLKLDRRGRLTVIAGTGAGNGKAAYSGDNRIRVIRAGLITTVAGAGRQGFSGDGGKAPEAELNTPQKIAIAKDGSVFIADRANHRVRKVDTRGGIITIAGTGKTTGMMFDPAIRD